MLEPTIPPILFLIGGIVILIGVGLFAYQRIRPTPVDPELAAQFVVEREALPVPIIASTMTADPIPASPLVIAPANISTPTATPEPFRIEGILFDQDAPVSLRFHVVENPGLDTPVVIPEFNVIGWYPDIFDDPDFFKPGDRIGVSHLDDEYRVGIWLHSGGSQTTMYPLQRWIEHEVENMSHALSANIRASEALTGIPVDVFVAGWPAASMRVGASVRIAPMDVPEMVEHVSDLIPYLAALEGEEANPDANKWTQARFIIALTTAWEPWPFGNYSEDRR
jgi:hypothetical protein